MSVGTSGQGDALIGRRIHGYVVQRKLGEGGMGAVYEVLQPGIGKRLALKVLHAEYAKKDAIVQRFFAEARAVNQIGHPNIVDILNYDQLEDGTYFILMEFLEGVSLARYIQQRGPMTPPEVAEILLPIADALAAAHHHGIVHRDLKPENVQLVDRHGTPRYVKLLDFGIAKLSSGSSPDAAAGAASTKTGQVMGTPTYMSPEQAMGRTKEIDHRTDVYALGIIMYQMLTGDVPFHADSFGDLMLLHLQQTPPALQYRRPDLAPVWNDIIQICLAKSREHRFGSMRELADAIRAALAGQPLARPAQPIGPHGTVALGPAPYVPSSYPSAEPTAPGADRTAPSGGYPATAPGSYPGTGPGTGPGAAWQAVPPASTGVSQPRRWLLPAVLAALVSGGAATAAILATRGDGAPAAVTAIDAAMPPDATVQAPDAATVAPPDAAIAVPPDAAVVEPRPDRPPPGVEREARGKTGTLRVSAIPWANVTINGKRYGQTPVTATVPAGKRIKVQAANPELGSKQTETVIVSDGETRTIRFTMSGS